MKKFSKIILLALVLSIAVPVITQAQPPVYGLGAWYTKAWKNIWIGIQSFGSAFTP